MPVKRCVGGVRTRSKALAFKALAGYAALALVAACADEAPPRQPETRARNAAPAQPPKPPAPAPAKQFKATAESGDAAGVLRRYYTMIEEGSYAQAHALREVDGRDAKAFAAHFERFASHKATVGTPSQPAEADGWLYVEVPVQTYGTMKNGTPFGSAGTVTLRRRKSGGPWRIFTKG
jgi:hypothetical protein